MPSVADIEALGAFYLGRRVDATGERTEEPVLYDAKDLTTHAVCVGMTGSGKTGLGVALIEEAILDGVPVIAIDPKGDLGNLKLAFPQLRAEDFRPWVDDGEAARQGRNADEQARFLADLWRKGLADWGQGPERIRRFRNAAEATIYTPGSTAGEPLAVLRSLAAPSAAVAADDEALRDKIMSAVSGLLGLLGIQADPIRSREHILLSTILQRAWSDGRDLDLPSLIREIQSPPFERVGVLDLDSFFPESERFELAMTLNNLIASPGFAIWTEGEALDVGKLLHSPDGSPRLSVLSIAHLSESERMFFVTLLLGEVLSWMRSQPGSRTLRAILYMDEVFGYFPPTANPPSKQPMLTLLKQARAYGLGVVLATQNPVDLDYKGLSNAGTWLLGRLQTERDKLRVIEGLEGAAVGAGGFDRAAMEATLSGLSSRRFVMNNVHEDGPVLFETRWVLSYLAGPLTRAQIKELRAANRGKTAPEPAPQPALVSREPVLAVEADPGVEVAPPERPVLTSGIEERFWPITKALGPNDSLVYRPALLGSALLHYARASAKVDEWQHCVVAAPLERGTRASPWKQAAVLKGVNPPLLVEPEAVASYGELPKRLDGKKFSTFRKQLASHLYRERPLVLYRCAKLKLYSTPQEGEADFRARVLETQREERDLAVEKLRARYAPKLARIQEQIERAEQRVEVEEEQLSQRKQSTTISIGASVLGAIFGRKLASARNVGRAGAAMKSASRISKEKADVERAQERVEMVRERLADLEARLESDLAALRSDRGEAPAVSELRISARKGDLEIEDLLLVWTPWRVRVDGTSEPAYSMESQAA